MSLLDDLLKEADDNLFEKKANDPNGAPENNQANAGSGEDIMSLANSFIQEVEAFKQSMSQGVAQNTDQQNVDQQNAQVQQGGQQVDPNLQAGSSTSATIQKPDGTIIKVGSLVKLASIYGGKAFMEVR